MIFGNEMAPQNVSTRNTHVRACYSSAMPAGFERIGGRKFYAALRAALAAGTDFSGMFTAVRAGIVGIKSSNAKAASALASSINSVVSAGRASAKKYPCPSAQPSLTSSSI